MEAVVRREKSICRVAVATAALFQFLLAPPALANGGDFFEELQRHWGEAGLADSGSPFFGFVRDARGKFIQGATVTATLKPTGSSRTFQTNILGHFTLPGFGKNVDPDNVAVSCAKAGYRQANVTRRHYKDRAMQPVEIQCTLAPITAGKPNAS